MCQKCKLFKLFKIYILLYNIVGVSAVKKLSAEKFPSEEYTSLVYNV